MANARALTFGQSVVDVAGALGYEDDSIVAIGAVDEIQIHIIWYTGDPVGKFLNAPNGSLSIDATNHHTYTKTGAPGSGKSGAWVVNS